MGKCGLSNPPRTEQRHCRSMGEAFLDKCSNATGNHPCKYAISSLIFSRTDVRFEHFAVALKSGASD